MKRYNVKFGPTDKNTDDYSEAYDNAIKWCCLPYRSAVIYDNRNAKIVARFLMNANCEVIVY